MAKQILKLGLSGSETTLPTESRINQQGADTPFFNESRSASKTLHVDFIATKENWTIVWDVISLSDYETVNTIVKQQYTGTFLSFIYTDSAGAETTKTVRVTVGDKGNLVQQSTWFYNGFSLIIEEV